MFVYVCMPTCLDFACVEGCIGGVGRAPNDAFVGPWAELCEMDVGITGSDT